ncbi:hypothetical protein HW132_24585 [Brasilonema sp. CT11]|nr:hypothetical protein [Brasilonema sp. CT11]
MSFLGMAIASLASRAKRTLRERQIAFFGQVNAVSKARHSQIEVHTKLQSNVASVIASETKWSEAISPNH